VEHRAREEIGERLDRESKCWTMTTPAASGHRAAGQRGERQTKPIPPPFSSEDSSNSRDERAPGQGDGESGHAAILFCGSPLRSPIKRNAGDRPRFHQAGVRFSCVPDHPVDDLHLVAGAPARRRGLGEMPCAVLVTDDDLVFHVVLRFSRSRVRRGRAQGARTVATSLPGRRHLMATTRDHGRRRLRPEA